MNLNKNMARMDSLMVASSCKKMSRLELVYTVIRNMVRTLDQMKNIVIPESFTGYLEDSHEKEVLYRTKSDQAESKLDILIKQASTLFHFVQDQTSEQETEGFEHLNRLLNEQCVQMEDGSAHSLPLKAKKLRLTVYKTLLIPMPCIEKKVARSMLAIL